MHRFKPISLADHLPVTCVECGQTYLAGEHVVLAALTPEQHAENLRWARERVSNFGHGHPLEAVAVGIVKALEDAK
jgi:hypothetical protein